MKVFRDMVQLKRKRMLCLTVLLVIVPFLSVGETINLTYILKRDGDRIQPSCVAEEFERYAAVGWVYPIPTSEQGIPNITTKYIPTIKNEYNCKFSKNDICSSRRTWLMKDWRIEENFDFLSDVRWEDLPTIFISNTTKEINSRIEVPKVFKSGISVRASGIVELLICTGWNPLTYPCYYFNINSSDIYLNKHAMLPKNSSRDDLAASSLEHYTAYSPIISHDEWRNFIVSFDEDNTLKLFDVNLNRIVIEHTDADPLKPAYLIMRSDNGSLWKIHKNEFLYTNTTQTSRLGPLLSISNKDLCVSLLVRTCPNCVMRFFYPDGSNIKDLKSVGPMQKEEWLEIKIKEENIPVDKLQLFIETKFKDPEALNDSDGFWAVDNIRVCNENEVKVSFLKLGANETEKDTSEEHISCQLIKMPSWRPKQLTYNKIIDFPKIDYIQDSSFIKMNWSQEDPQNQIRYFVSYKGNDICTSEPHNLRRVKSDGFLMTKLNEVVLDRLVPFTVYNITIATVLHEEDRRIQIKTLETVDPTFDELPRQVKVLPSESTVFVSWQEIKCTDVYGRLVYKIVVTDGKNFTKALEYRTENHYRIEGLQPYTLYNLNITTGRRAVDINNRVHTNSIALNFSTLAGVARAVENLELYSMDETSASLRYDLPKDPKGTPSEIQVTKCNVLSHSKCKTLIQKITHCPLWPQKYCVFVYNLPELVRLRVNLRNVGTKDFGEEASIRGRTEERVPGPPTDVTYKVVDCDTYTDYCNLNVSWRHPYYENGTITSFNIILNSTDMSKNTEEDIYIHEVYKVEDKAYLPTYTHQIRIVPYSTTYVLHLNSANTKYRSGYTSLVVKTDNLGDHIDQRPKLLENTSSSLIFKLPDLDRRLQSYNMTVIVQDFDRSKKVEPQLLEDDRIEKNLCHTFGETWVSQVLKVANNDTEKITIGNSEKDRIKPKTKYCITFIITNRYKGLDHDVVYYEKLETPEEKVTPKIASGHYNHLYILLLLLLLVPIGFLIYRYLRKRRIIRKPVENNENVYESMPFDDCETNCVSNENYDKLIHKD